MAANELGLLVLTTTSRRMADFAPRQACEGALVISVHSVGFSKNVVRLKESYLPGYYYFDRTGYSGWAELAFNEKLQCESVQGQVNDCQRLLEGLRAEKLEKNFSKYRQPDAGSKRVQYIEEPYFFFALQTTDDFVARLANINQMDLLFMVAKKARVLGVPLVVKRHPLCEDKFVEYSLAELEREDDNVFITNESVNLLITSARAIITVNSGVGFEALLFNKPVFCAGKSDYSFMAEEIKSEEDMIKLEDCVVKENRQVDEFVSYYLGNYCININNAHGVMEKIAKWQDQEYSSLEDLAFQKNVFLNETQSYMAELETLRRKQLLSFSLETDGKQNNSKGRFFKKCLSGFLQRCRDE
jgi:capsule polysaccharide export protein KpsC/LpsZ